MFKIRWSVHFQQELIKMNKRSQRMYTVNLEVLPQHQNRCKFLQRYGH